MKRKLISIILAVAFIAGVFGIKTNAYAKDVSSSAQVLEFGKDYKVNGKKEGWYKFKTTKNCSDYCLTSKITDGWSSIFFIYDEDGAEVCSARIYEYDGETSFWFSLKENSTYYVYYHGHASEARDDYLSYFKFNISPETDLADDMKNATPYTFGKEITEYRRVNCDDEWITFTTPNYKSSQKLYVKNIDVYYLDLEILDADGSQVYAKAMGSANEITETFNFDKNSKYYLHFNNYHTGKFKFSIKCNKIEEKKSESGGSKSNHSNYSNEWVNGKWYNADGSQTYNGTLSWKKNANGWWVEDSAGWYPKSQWQKIDGKWYYFLSSGYMDYSEYRDGCWLNADGSMATGNTGGHWCCDSNGWWYEDNGWYPHNQNLWIDGVQYWFGADGYWR